MFYGKDLDILERSRYQWSQKFLQFWVRVVDTFSHPRQVLGACETCARASVSFQADEMTGSLVATRLCATVFDDGNDPQTK